MTTKYTLQFKNSTNLAYHFVVYQKSPDSESIAWQVRGLGPNANDRVDWSLNYQIAIATWNTDARQYLENQIQPAELGKVYEVITEEGDIPVINTTPIDTTGPGLVALRNKTNPPQAVTMGFAISKALVAVEKQVQAGECAEFSVHPIYYIACCHEIKQGQLVSEGIELGPVTLEFQDENTDYTVEAVSVAGKVVLKDPVPTPLPEKKSML